jgi:outer membrane protein OmpA-like peptidoglycan-associated protein
LYPPINKSETTVILQKDKVVTKIEKIVEPVKKVVKHSKEIAKIISPSAKLDQLLKDNRYLYIESSGQISENSKEILEKIIPLLSNIDNSYIELEGHSSSQIYDYLTKKKSEQSAHAVYGYLMDKKVDKKIVVTGYGDLYPIIDDKKDKRNSRVELKIRRR